MVIYIIRYSRKDEIQLKFTYSPLTDADIRTDDETFRVPEDESMSASLVARLEELSFAEERILHTINLERGHGGSIGLQVMEGNDGGVYVQAVSVGGSADMAGNVNKGSHIKLLCYLRTIFSQKNFLTIIERNITRNNYI